MEIIMCLSVGILFTIAVYLILSRSLLRIILGTSALTHAVHLLLITLAGLKSGSPLYWARMQTATWTLFPKP